MPWRSVEMVINVLDEFGGVINNQGKSELFIHRFSLFKNNILGQMLWDSIEQALTLQPLLAE
jgi:hypothetical protein